MYQNIIHLPRDHNNICYWTNLFYPLFATNNVKKDVNSFYIFSLTKILSQETSLCCIMQNCSMPQSWIHQLWTVRGSMKSTAKRPVTRWASHNSNYEAFPNSKHLHLSGWKVPIDFGSTPQLKKRLPKDSAIILNIIIIIEELFIKRLGKNSLFSQLYE